MTTFAQFAQVCREVLMDGQPQAQFAQVCREVLLDGQPIVQMAQCAREVLMSDVPSVVAVYTPRGRYVPPPEEDPVRALARLSHVLRIQYFSPVRRAHRVEEEEPRAPARWRYPMQPSVVTVTIRPFIYVQT